MSNRISSLDRPFLQLNEQGDCLTERDFSTNILCTGSTGSGKSSGFGAHVLRALSRAASGLILCAKPSEATEVRTIFAQEGRLGSLIICNGRNHGFNFLAYMLARLSHDGINGLTEYLMRIIEMIRAASALPGGNGDAFWLDALRVLLRYSLLILYFGSGTLRITDLMAFIRSAPIVPDQYKDPIWRQNSFFYKCLVAASSHIRPEVLERLLSYWNDDFARMDPKLRGNILAGLMLLDRFNHGWLKDALCGETTFVPDLCALGVTIVIDTPRATMGEDGVIFQMIIKDAWQTFVLGRSAMAARFQATFIYCYADECQEVTTLRDAEVFAMSRSSRAGTIYLTQSVTAFYAKYGGQAGHDRAHNLIGNMGVRVFCACSCTVTNSMASEMIGKAPQALKGYSHNTGSSSQYGMSLNEGTNWNSNSSSGSSRNGSSGLSSSYSSNTSNGSSSGGNEGRGRNRGGGTNQGQSWSQNEHMDYIIPPAAFGQMLKTGGPANDFRVSAVVYQTSRVFNASGGNAILVEFQQ